MKTRYGLVVPEIQKLLTVAEVQLSYQVLTTLLAFLDQLHVPAQFSKFASYTESEDRPDDTFSINYTESTAKQQNHWEQILLYLKTMNLHITRELAPHSETEYVVNLQLNWDRDPASVKKIPALCADILDFAGRYFDQLSHSGLEEFKQHFNVFLKEREQQRLKHVSELAKKAIEEDEKKIAGTVSFFCKVSEKKLLPETTILSQRDSLLALKSYFTAYEKKYGDEKKFHPRWDKSPLHREVFINLKTITDNISTKSSSKEILAAFKKVQSQLEAAIVKLPQDDQESYLKEFLYDLQAEFSSYEGRELVDRYKP